MEVVFFLSAITTSHNNADFLPPIPLRYPDLFYNFSLPVPRPPCLRRLSKQLINSKITGRHRQTRVEKP
jgi:hypothetical protein